MLRSQQRIAVGGLSSRNDRIVDAFEFASKYDLQAIASGNGTTGAVQDQICGGSLSFGGIGYTLGFEAGYNAYATRQQVPMPFTLQMVNKLRPTPAALHMAWETLTFAGSP